MASMPGSENPNWRGGKLQKTCATCAEGFEVRPGRPGARFCSMQCVGISQRGRVMPRRAQVLQRCRVCSTEFSIYRSHAHRKVCCSRPCYIEYRRRIHTGPRNPNWQGGIGRLPYPWNFRVISRRIIARDGRACQNPQCSGTDLRMTTHHIDYDKSNCADANLIALCSACNSKANYGRSSWQAIYSAIVAKRLEAAP